MAERTWLALARYFRSWGDVEHETLALTELFRLSGSDTHLPGRPRLGKLDDAYMHALLTIGQAVRDARERQKVPQQEVEVALNTTRGYMSTLENARLRSVPRLDHLVTIADMLGMDAGELRVLALSARLLRECQKHRDVVSPAEAVRAAQRVVEVLG